MSNNKGKKIIITVLIIIGVAVVSVLLYNILSTAITTALTEYFTEMEAAQNQVIEDAEDAVKKSNIAEAKSLVALVFAENLYKEEMVDGELVQNSPEELEKIINDTLLTEFGPEYTVTLAEDYKVTYNFEIE